MEESEIEKNEANESNLVLRLSNEGLAIVLKDYQEVAMKHLWETGTGQSSRDAWMHVNHKMKNEANPHLAAISRASIINFLNAMVDEGLLDYHEITGKGGHRRIYKATKNEEEFWGYVTNLTMEKLRSAAFPDVRSSDKTGEIRDATKHKK